jgi:indole-3-glycerol phosphate synthase
MTSAVPDILARIVQHKARELEEATRTREQLEAAAVLRRGARRDFEAALRGSTPAIIAEIKQASPSKGVLVENFDPVSTARAYQKGGAAALSVLTDSRFFCGSLDDLETARGAVTVPVLRKDFTTSEYHVVEAAAHGADAILLIAAILDEATLRRFREMASSYGMAAIVEVHDGEELDKALGSGARIIGVNNRNLRTFETKLETSIELAERIPGDVLKVAESGIDKSEDVKRLQEAGYKAFLVGEHLMRSADPAEALMRLRS